MKMSHRRSQAWLAEYAADELAPIERRALTAHLELCKVCQQDLAEIRHIRAMMRSFAMPAAFLANESIALIDRETYLAAQERASALAMPGRQYRSNADAGRGQRQHKRKLLSTLAAVLLSLAIVLSSAFLFAQMAERNSAPATQPYRTPTVMPSMFPSCPTSTPGLSATASATPTPTPIRALSPVPTPAPEGCPTPTIAPTLP